MAIFFTSDEHYGHRNIINFCKRPFADIDEMREELIRRHNERVTKGDIVYHLGDMFWRTVSESEAHNILDQLNGQQYYVDGNHEEVLKKHKSVRERFIWSKDIAVLKIENLPRIILCHYAMRVWPGSHQGSWQLYGHSHAELPEPKELLSTDVGVDAWNHYPVSLEQIMVQMYMKQGAACMRQAIKEKKDTDAVAQAILKMAAPNGE